ncbi:MAG: transporter [Terracidiphilus sp.]|jgi:hypothetical protein
MSIKFGKSTTSGTGKRIGLCLMGCFIAGMVLSVAARATENGACVYPVGAETVLQGMIPPPKATGLFTFSILYSANEVDNPVGSSSAPEFKVRVFANAVKVVHNWGVPALGGMVESTVAIPFIYQQLHILPGKYDKFGLSNVDLVPFGVAYHKGDWHWFYQADFFLPGAPYNHTDTLNIGQHNFAAGPVGAFTYLSKKAVWEASSKVDYIVNFEDGSTKYRSGNELTWEYSGMRAVSKKASLGVNGYLYKQVTDDQSNGTAVAGGNRGRDFAIGPEARFFFGGHNVFAFKYTHDTLVENKPRGSSVWFELGFPLAFGKKE